MTTTKYVLQHLTNELQAIQNSLRAHELPVLTDYEKAIIYKYSNDGYESLNSVLRGTKGIYQSDYRILLEKALKKLPVYEGIVYRGANLTKAEVAPYYHAYENNILATEHAFISTTKVRSIAKEFHGNCLFKIVSKTGREIEK